MRIARYYTYYKTSYGVVKARIASELAYSEAVELGKNYCKSNNYLYLGTYDDEYADISLLLKESGEKKNTVTV
ncbi:hypothetical protein WKH56_05870 [Priestia sp. SB1]|uniref:Uncharacterized protein n=1 Tax=Priestia aryabhattai TaxID=412384 RepID=A0AAX6NC60_PRIAR|nr:hypothetical protein [Priestia aryabhattai]MDU9693491.1 hypothetical protein [Priestia aryabhattai]